MSSFESWMRQQGLSESSAKKYGSAVSGPLTVWANSNGILSGALTAIKDFSTYQPISSAIKKLPIFVETNNTGHQMYSGALIKFAEYLQRSQETPTSKTTTPLAEQMPVSKENRASLANKMVEALPGSRRRQQHDLEEGGGFRIMADGNQCAAVYFSNNAPAHLIEFSLDAKRIAVGEAEYKALNSWLGNQKKTFGGHDARNHKIGKQVDWFRIGFSTYRDAVLFVQQLDVERRNPLSSSRWTAPNFTSTAPASNAVRSHHTASDELSSAFKDTWASTALRMVKTARHTTASANGQVVSQTIKTKNNGFHSENDFVNYVKSLIEHQNGYCAISGLQLHTDTALANDEMKASLDRIDSNGHYEAGNLQVVCRFINRWKGPDLNIEFIQLIELLRQH